MGENGKKLGFLDNDSRFGVMLSQFLSLCALNIIWLALSLPIITIGASTSSLHYALRRLQEGETRTLGAFFAGWKKCWKQATLIWLSVLLMAFLLFLCFRIAQLIGGSFERIAICVFSVPTLFLTMIACYSLPLVARFKLTFFQTVTDSVLLALAHFPRTLLIICLNLLPFLILRFAPAVLSCVIFVWVPVGFAYTALLIQRLLAPTLKQYE